MLALVVDFPALQSACGGFPCSIDSTPFGESTDRSLLHECLLAPPTTCHHLIVHTRE